MTQGVPQAAMSDAPALRSRETICHFLDGVVARRGRPLALREGVAPVPPGTADTAPVAQGPDLAIAFARPFGHGAWWLGGM